MYRGRRGLLSLALLASATAVPLAAQVATAPPVAAATPPDDTPARVGVPANIYAIGDSITTATGTGNLGAETPANSWVTGTNGSVNSMRQRLAISTGNAVNLASNGRRMQDFDDQANQLPSSTAYVVVDRCFVVVGFLATLVLVVAGWVVIVGSFIGPPWALPVGLYLGIVHPLLTVYHGGSSRSKTT